MKYLEFAERFTRACLFCKRAPTAQKSLGIFLGISGPMVSYLRNGERLPSTKTATTIAKKLDVNYDWLMTGRGEMALSQRDKLLGHIFSEEIEDNPHSEPLTSNKNPALDPLIIEKILIAIEQSVEMLPNPEKVTTFDRAKTFVNIYKSVLHDNQVIDVQVSRVFKFNTCVRINPLSVNNFALVVIVEINRFQALFNKHFSASPVFITIFIDPVLV